MASDENKTTPPAPELTETQVEIRGRRLLLGVFFVCVLSELFFVVADYHLNYRQRIDIAPVRHLFNNTREDAIGSWFAITQTALVGLTAWVIYITVRARECSRFVRWGWLILALFFTYMTMDDGAEIHERMGSTFKAVQQDASREAGEDTMGRKLLKFFPSYSWQVVYLPGFAVMGLFIIVFLWRELGDRFSRFLVLAGISCFVLAVSMDFIEGLDEDHAMNLWVTLGDVPAIDAFTEDRFDRNGYTAIRHFGKAVEESIEMLGMTLLWLAFLRYLIKTSPKTNVRIT